jgi:hypothetical protein
MSTLTLYGVKKKISVRTIPKSNLKILEWRWFFKEKNQGSTSFMGTSIWSGMFVSGIILCYEYTSYKYIFLYNNVWFEYNEIWLLVFILWLLVFLWMKLWRESEMLQVNDKHYHIKLYFFIWQCTVQCLWNIKFMCMRLKYWDRGEVLWALYQFCTKYTSTLYIYSISLILCLSCRKNHINPWVLIFELNNKIIQLSVDIPYWYFLSTSELIYN